MIVKTFWLLVPIFSLSCLVHAADPVERNPDATEAIAPPWELYDIDEDGYISFEEAAAQKMPKQIFEGLDIDRDGRLNRDEFAKMPPIPMD